MKHQSLLMRELFSLLADNFTETAFKRYKMHDLIWGYHDPMMTKAMSLLPDWFYTDFVGVFAGVSMMCYQSMLRLVFGQNRKLSVVD